MESNKEGATVMLPGVPPGCAVC